MSVWAQSCESAGGKAMVCAACGCEIVDGVHFCKACGARVQGTGMNAGFAQQPWMPLGQSGAGYGGRHTAGTAYVPYAAPPMVQGQRVRQNLQALGSVWCAWGVYRLLRGLIAGFTVRTVAHHFGWYEDGSDFMPGFWQALVPVIALSTVVMSGLSLLAGYGLLTRKSWGRTLAIVMAILSLIRIPLGTALGIYTLWALGPRVSGLEYEGIVAAGETPRVERAG